MCAVPDARPSPLLRPLRAKVQLIIYDRGSLRRSQNKVVKEVKEQEVWRAKRRS